MPTVFELKQQEVTETPLFLFDCHLRNGDVLRCSTHQVTVGGSDYDARVVGHNAFDLRSSFDEGLDSGNKLSLRLANADSYFSQLERSVGFKGATVTVKFVFFDLAARVPASESQVLFRGIANPPDEITETGFRISFGSRLNYQRILLPEVRIQKRCPWAFPSTNEQREIALNGGEKGKYSPLYRCGYSAGLPGGVGNLNGAVPHTSCSYTRSDCQARGMFATGRFGGHGFVPASMLVRTYGEKSTHLSPVADNEAKYNDVVPLVYGTAWYQPPVVFSRNDGNLTRMEVLLGMGPVDGPVKVLVSDVEIPEGVDGTDMTATGWYTLVSPGGRDGVVNPDFPEGDPHGSMAVLSVVVPNRIHDGKNLPKVNILLRGLKLPRFDASGAFVDEVFTNNPAWVLLDVLRRSGWSTNELDLRSFSRAANFCQDPVSAKDIHGNSTTVPRYQCNLVLRKRRSAADVIRGIRNGSAIFLRYGAEGLLQLQVEHKIGVQQPLKPELSNAIAPLFGGWPAYEFSDGSADFSGILRRANGEPSLRLWSRSSAESPNRFSVEFQDEFNEYQQDSLSLVDVDDALLTDQEVGGALTALGMPNFDQAARILRLHLEKSVRGNLHVEFETSVRALGLAPGDLITLTYLKEGLDRQLFRITRISPGMNFRNCKVTAQVHEEAWYDGGGEGGQGGRRGAGNGVGIPRPLVGDETDTAGNPQFSVREIETFTADGGQGLTLEVGFVPPAKPSLSAASIPILSLSANVEVVGGTLPGGAPIYYAISALDAQGKESPLSFLVAARIPAGTNTNVVTLEGLSFSQSSVSFSVYRGPNPTQLRRIAVALPLAGTFTDLGIGGDLVGPPDENFDHANFYWRSERVPETSATLFSPTTIGAAGLGLLPNEHRGAAVLIVSGKGARQERTIIANSETELTVGRAWDVVPDSTSRFIVSDSAWRFGALSQVSPVAFEVPSRAATTVQILGRAANVLDQESPLELSPVRRWTVGAGGGGDADVPPTPVFGLTTEFDGSVLVGPIGFSTLANTSTITAGTLGLWYWNELEPDAVRTLALAIDAVTVTIELNIPGAASVGELLQIEAEIMRVEEVLDFGLRYRVTRGFAGSLAGAHSASTAVYELKRSTHILPFVRGFFGTLASGSYTARVPLPNTRICVAELFMTNAFGDGALSRIELAGASTAYGLRTMYGGMVTLQVDGYLAVQPQATPPLVVDRKYSIKQVGAVLRDAVLGGPLVIRVHQDGADVCTLTVPSGDTEANAVDGQFLPVLQPGAQVGIDILSVPILGNTYPGRDLSVWIRL
ncbi:hypothetical protein F183_A43910 [Bryobacterales bacterium F-183]|nr:hypothetical protein F183_A43910 [Bryobacterales bacterium F-183]